MKFTLSWLKEHLETSASLTEICEKLTAIGLEVEQVVNHAEALKPFIVAEIISAEPHPNAGKLQVCKVNNGKEELQIVCGAANARAGLKIVLAQEGVVIPNGGMVIKKTKIRDVESNGMICSAEELGLEESSEGIIELPASTKVGSPAATALGADDPVIEINLTPNRGDCLGVRGIARDLAAAGIGKLSTFPIPKVTHKFASLITVTIEDSNCPLFIGCYIKGVKNGPSPEWLQRKLKAIGLKPISMLVDVTNYFCFTFGRPLHVFDADTLTGNITVRSTKEGETLKALNDKEYKLQPGMVVIADERGAQGVGGVIGGLATGCSDKTQNVFLEVALFDPVSIAKTGRALDLQTDARYRFERGVDSAFAQDAAILATEMILELCGGEPSEFVIAGAAPKAEREIKLPKAQIAALGGVAFDDTKISNILTALGFKAKISPDEISAVVPSFRPDVEGAADLIEELLRINGYANIPSTALPKLSTLAEPTLTPTQKRVALSKRALAMRGLKEAVTWSFVSENDAKHFGGVKPELKLLNPISEELSHMRPSILPNLLQAARNNANRGFKNLGLFEVGVTFSGIDAEQTVATTLRAGVLPDTQYPDQMYQGKERAVDVFDAKADALALFSALGLNKCDIVAGAPAWYHPGRSGTLTLGGKIILGYFGEIHPALLKAYDVGNKVVACEIFLGQIPLPRAKSKARATLQLSDFQAVQRDFAFTIDANVSVAEIIKAVNGADKALIQETNLFDVYVGKGVDAGKKSVAINCLLQADHTLTDAEIQGAAQKVIDAVSKLGGVLRA